MEFGMVAPSSPEEIPEEPSPSPIDEDTLPPEEKEPQLEPLPPSEGDEPEGEISSDRTDAPMNGANAEFPYRLAIMKDGGLGKVVACHVSVPYYFNHFC